MKALLIEGSDLTPILAS